MLRLTAFALMTCMVFAAGTAEAATKKKTTKQSQFTKEQREKMTEQGRKMCRKQYGATSRLIRIDYSRMQVWCYTG